ncbi:CHY zinc finger protein [Lacticaseibacillus manihotivorans]|uniref:CHY-type domain-containing protein n=2 Tax=Lacticaseibacillus manihotivorans TaxID=88233 RepID=A0A0R1QFK5_9LACO|nr:CHY zinc finger protein [Lacticaseibacillus manihotivorans]KRL43329.1 hypothetical protein FD01_GL001732 [Lacticaseibacillus manihotivorans DSM 13343 = JCM 12514]QFQ92420.1 hypothetical protein LM010_13785 [Lacticaseibacillus manihotivorans]
MLKPKIYGQQLDVASRCRHYHSDLDVVALWCGQCQKFWACYEFHDAMGDHEFVPLPKAQALVLCGACRCMMTYSQYQSGACPNCWYPFNPRCELHTDHYFQ